ncbi:MAG: hypothetical protein OXI74_04490 [Rhodospirillaceae bacterium]|nr:hypothetical protein [Rhodospirillaceae bacterium]
MSCLSALLGLGHLGFLGDGEQLKAVKTPVISVGLDVAAKERLRAFTTSLSARTSGGPSRR